MPRGDGKGPAGKGPRTGGQRGRCVGAKPRRRSMSGKRKGLGKGRGRKSS